MLHPYLTQGGPLMWPLLACSVALVAALAERCWAHATPRRGGRPGPSQPPARPGIHPFFWEVPPQIGLLGTVIGLIQIFRGGLGPEAFGHGVGVACLTTVFGLGIALVARSADHFLVGWAASRRKEDNTLFDRRLAASPATCATPDNQRREALSDAPDGSNSLFSKQKRESDPEASAVGDATPVHVGAQS